MDSSNAAIAAARVKVERVEILSQVAIGMSVFIFVLR
jgi:hypothetical protein